MSIFPDERSEPAIVPLLNNAQNISLQLLKLTSVLLKLMSDKVRVALLNVCLICRQLGNSISQVASRLQTPSEWASTAFHP